jgi:predicted N-acetyltransferase YhbS
VAATDPGRDVRAEVVIRPMGPADVDAADRITRIAFGTFLGAPDPIAVFGEMEHVRSRFAADPSRAFVATLDGDVVGSVLATRWGSYGSFGPLTVTPELWDAGVGGRLMEPVMELFERWGVRQAGLFTFAQSPKHVGLYQRFGFWPQQLTAVMAKEVTAAGAPPPTTYADAASDAVLRECRGLSGAIFDGLDLGSEIRAVDALSLGDTVLVRDRRALAGFAVCHCGAGESGAGACYVKFAAAAGGHGAAERFERLIDACEALAVGRGLERVVGGVNLARHDAYRRLRARGYRARTQGVVMQRPNEPGYCRPDAYVLDDLR